MSGESGKCQLNVRFTHNSTLDQFLNFNELYCLVGFKCRGISDGPFLLGILPHPISKSAVKKYRLSGQVSLNHAIHTSINLSKLWCDFKKNRPQLDKDPSAGRTLLKSKENPRENLRLLIPHLVCSHSGARRVSRNRCWSFRR